MKHRGIGLCVLAFTLAALGVGLSQAAELEGSKVRHRHVVYRHAIVLPPERHVIEIVKNAYGDRFIINAARFSAKTPACGGRWLAGEQVQFLSGEIHGACVDAVIYNARRHQACEMWCGGSLFW
ncbi:MAG TPA: hypothetical protein VF913_01910 [Xanthobacteraceae bacterium]